MKPIRELEINTDFDEFAFPDTSIFKFNSIHDITDKIFFMWGLKGSIHDIIGYTAPLIITENEFGNVHETKFRNQLNYIQKRMLEYGLVRVYYTDKKTLLEYKYNEFPLIQTVSEFIKLDHCEPWRTR